MTLMGLSRQCNAFDYSRLCCRTVGSHPVKGNWNQGEANPFPCFTIAKWGFLRGSSIAGSGVLLGGEVYVCSIRCTTFEFMSFWIEQDEILHLRVLWLSFVMGIISVYLLRPTVPSWQAPCTIELLWEQWGTAGNAVRISVSALGFI